MPKQFSYGQSLLNAKGDRPIQPEKHPQAAEPVNRTAIEQGLNVAAPSEPFGTGLAQEPAYEIPPAKELEFGGSGGSAPAAPVEQPPEDNPVRQQPKLHPKPAEAAKVQSPHGSSGLEGYFDGEDGDDPDEVEPSEQMAEPGSPDEYMDPDDTDPEDLARIEREQMEAKIRAEVEAEYATKPSGKKNSKAGKTGGKQGRSVAYTGRGIKREDVETARLRNIPKCLVDIAKAAFPDATRQEDAVAAYIYFREGMPKHLVVPDEIAELASKYSGENVTLGTVRDLVERDVLDLKVQNRELTRKLEAVELAVAYAIFEAAGFRKSDPTGPEAVDFLEHGIADLLKRLETQSELKRQRDRQREGRPIR